MLKMIVESFYAWIYVSIGIGLLAYFGINALIEYRQSSGFLKILQEVMGTKPSLKDQLSTIAGYFLASLIILFVWPIFVSWLGIQKWKERKEQLEGRKPKFYCKKEYLQHLVTTDQAERDSYITDPLDLTPKIAFGHLNKAWCTFLAELEEYDELWSYEIPVGSITGKTYGPTKALIKGYARVKRNEIVGEFVYQSG
jgi:hypothetical protein